MIFMCTCFASMHVSEPREVYGVFGWAGTGVTASYESPCGSQAMNLGLLQEQLDESPISPACNLVSLKQSLSSTFYEPLKDKI